MEEEKIPKDLQKSDADILAFIKNLNNKNAIKKTNGKILDYLKSFRGRGLVKI